MEVIGLAIGVIIGAIIIFIIIPSIQEERELKVKKSYDVFQQELEIEKEKNRQYFKAINDKQIRFQKELTECNMLAEVCITLVTTYKDEIDDDEWREWMLLENAACMPISMSRVFKKD